jgi:transposase
MNKRRYKEGIDRRQDFLLPPSLEEYVGAHNPVRAIDLYVDSLDLAALGFKNAGGELTPGQPAYPPQALLKLYLYGYVHAVRSSRKLAQECHRNLEVIWLVGGLRPGYKSIADFRKDNLEAVKAVNRDFVHLCKLMDLFGRELVSIDGSFFRGNVGKKHLYTQERVRKALERIEQHISEYLAALEQADAAEDQLGEEKSETQASLQVKLDELRTRQRQHQARLEKLVASGEKQLAEVDEDARLLRKNGQSLAGYNVQAAVDHKHKLIVVAEATQDGNDQQQLEPMAKAAQAVLEDPPEEQQPAELASPTSPGSEAAAEAEVDSPALTVVADPGYFNAQQIKNCVEAGITPYVPEPDKTRQASQQGRFTREDFTYCAETNTYTCPRGEALRYTTTQNKQGKRIWVYVSQAAVCAQCPLKSQCLPAKTPYRQVTRWEHEDLIDAHRQRMAEQGSQMMRTRACLAEHPFGSLKLSLGWTHFLLRGLDKVQAELSLMVLSYNFKRALNILGMEVFRTYCLQRA